jgi:hypothetical protein
MMIDIDSIVDQRLSEEERTRMHQHENNQAWFEWEFMFRPLAARVYDEVKRNFPERKLVVLSSDPELPGILGIPAWNVRTFIPTDELSRAMTRRMDDAVQAVVSTSRTEIIRHVKKLKIFNSFDALYT